MEILVFDGKSVSHGEYPPVRSRGLSWFVTIAGGLQWSGLGWCFIVDHWLFISCHDQLLVVSNGSSRSIVDDDGKHCFNLSFNLLHHGWAIMG